VGEQVQCIQIAFGREYMQVGMYSSSSLGQGHDSMDSGDVVDVSRLALVRRDAYFIIKMSIHGK
jgi:hypothetical protein